MSDAFYQGMRELATGLLTDFGQGVLELTRTERADPAPATPWVPSAVTTTKYLLAGAVAPVERRFVDGVNVIQSDSQASVAVEATLTHVNGDAVAQSTVHLSDVEPTPSDTFTVDGRPRTVLGVRRVPDAGVAVAYMFILRE